jgi:hypothetical protein
MVFFVTGLLYLSCKEFSLLGDVLWVEVYLPEDILHLFCVEVVLLGDTDTDFNRTLLAFR